MLQEVAFHDIEVGGFNDYDGAPTKYSHIALQKLSSQCSRKFFPQKAFTELRVNFQIWVQKPYQVVDVGCGLLSTLRYGAVSRKIEITGIDPLLELYEFLLCRHG